MLSHWVIKLLNIIFVFSMGMVTLWLFYRSLASDKVRRSSPSKRAELFLRVSRNNTPFLKIPLEKSHYLIGRGRECEIPLKGMGIPLIACEIFIKGDNYSFKNLQDNSVSINGQSIEKGSREIVLSDTIKLYNYTITIEST